MNEFLKTALQEARTAAEAALAAAKAGNREEALRQLTLLDELRENCTGGNAAAGASRAKTLRIEAETLALLDELPAETVVAPVAEQPEAQPQDANDAVAGESQQAPAKARTARSVAPAHSLSAEQWERVAVALTDEGATVDELDAEAARCEAQQVTARAERQTFRAKVMERQALQARVEAAALRGDVEAANAAWDRLFDVVTAIRSMEGTHRRKNGGQPDPEKAAAYDVAREASLKIRRWARGVAA